MKLEVTEIIPTDINIYEKDIMERFEQSILDYTDGKFDISNFDGFFTAMYCVPFYEAYYLDFLKKIISKEDVNSDIGCWDFLNLISNYITDLDCRLDDSLVSDFLHPLLVKKKKSWVNWVEGFKQVVDLNKEYWSQISKKSDRYWNLKNILDSQKTVDISDEMALLRIEISVVALYSIVDKENEIY